MSDETTTTDHSETIEKARRLLTEVTPGRWEIDGLFNAGQYGNAVGKSIDAEHSRDVAWVICQCDYPCDCHIRFERRADADAIAVAPDLLAALVALADERDALRAERQHVINLLNDELRGIDTNRYPDSALDVFFARGMKFAFRFALGMLGDVPSKDDQP